MILESTEIIEVPPEYDYEPLLDKLDVIIENTDRLTLLAEFGFAFVGALLCAYCIVNLLLRGWGD